MELFDPPGKGWNLPKSSFRWAQTRGIVRTLDVRSHLRKEEDGCTTTSRRQLRRPSVRPRGSRGPEARRLLLQEATVRTTTYGAPDEFFVRGALGAVCCNCSLWSAMTKKRARALGEPRVLRHPFCDSGIPARDSAPARNRGGTGCLLHGDRSSTSLFNNVRGVEQ